MQDKWRYVAFLLPHALPLFPYAPSLLARARSLLPRATFQPLPSHVLCASSVGLATAGGAMSQPLLLKAIKPFSYKCYALLSYCDPLCI